MSFIKNFWRASQTIVQWLTMALFALLAAGLVVATVLAAFGVWPWIEMPLVWNGTPVEAAGMILQIGLTVLAAALCFFLPSNARILRLEHTHRRFDVDLNDITRAYAVAHSADRARTFKIADAFEETRDRLAYLRDHPDLEALEPELLEIAAQMSYISRDIADRYADDKVERARGFLEQRQYELETLQERIEKAKVINSEFKTWINRIELEESVAAAQMERLLDELERVLPEINSPHVPARHSVVTQLPKRLE